MLLSLLIGVWHAHTSISSERSISASASLRKTDALLGGSKGLDAWNHRVALLGESVPVSSIDVTGTDSDLQIPPGAAKTSSEISSWLCYRARCPGTIAEPALISLHRAVP